ncbi:cell division ATP-binding protein FtsE [Leptolyngbya sp. O-77]|uniref:cell division ATP-binding protein FtsE n=1 Tax=Leptolyngbya sp. O-77 TaxID=1080068 RepID=UPI00074D491C|nr:cell division ATP-binding protein FtsE [Leptolyngbya sp. O-77]BAU42507.1 Cell division ATP-binding protein FtsE [Leptolyngbya sp. O-77]
MTTVSDRPLIHTPRDLSLRDLSSVQSRIHTIPTANQRDSIVRLQQVTKVYANGSRALENVNLQVRRGDFLFVTGPSGSGKSTLLKLLYGAERPTQGQVQVHDTNLSDLRGDRLSMLRRRIGVVFQDYKLIPRRTVAENVAFVLQAQGYARREIQRRLLPTLKMVGLHDKAERFPDELSGGEQQRVSIARAIVSTPPILLADEPTGNLDADNSWQVIKILKKLNAVGITVIITTHDDRLVRMSNHPVVQLRNGRLFHVN